MITIRPAGAGDVRLIVELERTCPAAAHWSDEQYEKAIDSAGAAPERLVLVAETDDSVAQEREVSNADKSQAAPQGRGALVGFLVAQHVSGEWELENIVVDSESRGRGIGKQLLDALVARARDANGGTIFLEVRDSNQAARKLYEKAGFRETGRRRLYYSDPAEDAILYSRRV